MFDSFIATEIPLDPPFPKGEVFRQGPVPLFEKEGLGEILNRGYQQVTP